MRKIGWTYFLFLIQSLAKRKTIWIFGGLYILFTIVLLIILPAIIKTSPWLLWHNISVNPQAILLYVAAIFGALISVAIFKNYQDDGTELILLSKPISRSKATLIKFVVFFCFSFFFALISIFIAPLTFLLKDVTEAEVGGLVVSMLFSNFIALAIFGMLATLISLFANKIWTILGNVIVIVLLTILSTVNMIVVKTPAGITEDNGYPITSVRYLGNDNKDHSFAALTPKIDLNNIDKPISFLNLEEEKKLWAIYTNESNSHATNLFDFVGQFNFLNNMAGLSDSANKDASQFYGSNRFYDYNFDKQVINQSNNNLPYYFVQNSDQFSCLNFDFSSEESIADGLLKVINKYLELITGQTIVMLGDMQTTASSFTMSTLKSNEFNVAYGHKGYIGSGNDLIRYGYSDLQVNESQKNVFDKILTAICGDDTARTSPTFNFYDNSEANKDLSSIVNYINDPVNATAPMIDAFSSLFSPTINFDKDIDISSVSSYQSVLDTDDLKRCKNTSSQTGSFSTLYNFIHMCIIGANKGITDLDGNKTSTGEYKNVFWDSDLSLKQANEQLMQTMVKFKLYIFQKYTKEINSDLYKAANTTSLNLGKNLDFNSSPVLPLQINSNGQYDMDAPLPTPFEKIKIPVGVWMSICPTLQADFKKYSTGIWELNQKYNWANGTDQDSYFTNANILKMRALLDWAIKTSNIGYSNANLSGMIEDTSDSELGQALERDRNYDFNLSTSNLNFPITYELLGATYTVTLKYQSSQLVLIWAAIALLLTSMAFVIYLRTDFK